jgi:TetR/AcrR family transcriptional regulator, regulator of cefoperazone and chloramphenicol sensitivity
VPETRIEEPRGPRRRPPTGGYARGAEKRIRIIEAAVRRFGEDGYDGASTRQIAEDAGVNPPALQYYFDSKEGLYAACYRHISNGFAAAMTESYRRSARAVPDAPQEAVEIFCDLLDAVADFLFETAEAKGWGRFLARVQARDGDGPIDPTLSGPDEDEFASHCFRLAGLAIGQPASEVETRLRAFAAMSPLTAFHLERANILTRLGWPDLRGPRLVQFKALLRRQAKAALG